MSENDFHYDPTKNTLDLVNAAIRRMDDLRVADAERASQAIEFQARISAANSEKIAALMHAESSRIDSILATNASALVLANEKTATVASALAASVANTAETLRNQVSTTAMTTQQQTAALRDILEKRISLLEKTLSDQALNFVSKESTESNMREERVARDVLTKDIQKAIDNAATALAEHTIRDETNHVELADRITREINDLKKMQYQPGATAILETGLEKRITSVENTLSAHYGRDTAKEQDKSANQWATSFIVASVISFVNFIILVVFHFWKG